MEKSLCFEENLTRNRKVWRLERARSFTTGAWKKGKKIMILFIQLYHFIKQLEISNIFSNNLNEIIECNLL